MPKSQGRKNFRPYNICLNDGCIIFIQIVITDTRLGIITNSSTIMDLFDNAEGECCMMYNALTESKFNINLRGAVYSTPADAGMDIVSSDVQNVILNQDATPDVRDAGFDIADAISDNIYSDEGLDSVDSDTIREDIWDSNTGDIEVSDTELEDNARSDDIVRVSDSRSDQSEESSGCSCSVVE